MRSTTRMTTTTNSLTSTVNPMASSTTDFITTCIHTCSVTVTVTLDAAAAAFHVVLLLSHLTLPSCFAVTRQSELACRYHCSTGFVLSFNSNSFEMHWWMLFPYAYAFACSHCCTSALPGAGKRACMNLRCTFRWWFHLCFPAHISKHT